MAPNDEFIREVDDEYRRDRVAQMWKRYNGLIIGGVLVMLALVGGWRYWEHVQETRAQEAGARFEEALRLSRDEKSEEAKPVFEALAKEADGGYTLLARFRLAERYISIPYLLRRVLRVLAFEEALMSCHRSFDRFGVVEFAGQLE